MRRRESLECGAFGHFQSVGYPIEVDTWSEIAEIDGSHSKPRKGGSLLLGLEAQSKHLIQGRLHASFRGVHGGSKALGHIIVEYDRRPHVMMLTLKHHDVKSGPNLWRL